MTKKTKENATKSYLDLAAVVVRLGGLTRWGGSLTDSWTKPEDAAVAPLLAATGAGTARSSAMVVTRRREPSLHSTTIRPSLVQQLLTPWIRRASTNTECLVPVRNSDIVTPEPLSFVFEDQTRFRSSSEANRKRRGLGLARSFNLPRRWHTWSDCTEISCTSRFWVQMETAVSFALSFATSGIPWSRRTLTRDLISISSKDCATISICACRVDIALQMSDLNCLYSSRGAGSVLVCDVLSNEAILAEKKSFISSMLFLSWARESMVPICLRWPEVKWSVV